MGRFGKHDDLIVHENEPFNAEIEELTAAGKPLGDAFARRGVVAAALALPEWQATIDALTALDWIGADGPNPA